MQKNAGTRRYLRVALEQEVGSVCELPSDFAAAVRRRVYVHVGKLIDYCSDLVGKCGDRSGEAA